MQGDSTSAPGSDGATGSPTPKRSGRDTRKWQTIALPDEVAIIVFRAMYLAISCGEAKNRIEALECISGSYVAEKLPELILQAERAAGDGERALRRLNGLIAFNDAGWRCLVCGTAPPLQAHHGVPRGQGGHDDPDNLFPLCPADHEAITTAQTKGWTWPAALEVLRELKAEAKLEVEANGGWRHRPAEPRLRLPKDCYAQAKPS